MRPKPKNPQFAKGNLLELAEAVSLLYGQKGAEAAIEELRDVLEDYRVLLSKRDQDERLTFLLRLILACPVLLKRPPGFEWVTDALYETFHNRKYDQTVDGAFWVAVEKVRGMRTKGRPGNKVRDLFRYDLVQTMMNPVSTAPGKGLIRVKGYSKTEAVEKMAEMEAQWSGRNSDTRDIWRSLERVEGYLARMKGQLEGAQGSQTRRPQKHR